MSGDIWPRLGVANPVCLRLPWNSSSLQLQIFSNLHCHFFSLLQIYNNLHRNFSRTSELYCLFLGSPFLGGHLPEDFLEFNLLQVLDAIDKDHIVVDED